MRKASMLQFLPSPKNKKPTFHHGQFEFHNIHHYTDLHDIFMQAETKALVKIYTNKIWFLHLQLHIISNVITDTKKL